MAGGKPHLASKRKPTAGKAGLYDATKQLPQESFQPQTEAPQTKRPRMTSADLDGIDEPQTAEASNSDNLQQQAPQTGAVLAKAPRKRATSKKPAQRNKGKGKASDFVPTVAWPEHFIKLEQVFKSLNTVYTFCQARRHMATTFETLKSSVEGLLKRPLEIHDVAQIRALLPSLINFVYVEPDALQVLQANADGQTDHYVDVASAAPRQNQTHVLFFQFNDGELRAVGGTGKAITKRWRRKGTDHQPEAGPSSAKSDAYQPKKANPTPVFTASSMSKLIDRRNQVFRLAVDELLVASTAQDHDPLQLLQEATEEHMPVKPADPSNPFQTVKPLSERRADLDFFLRHPQNRPSIENILLEMREQEWYDEQIVEGGHRIVEARESQFGSLDMPLSEPIMDALWQTKKITSLYTHQAEAINHLASGDNVIVSTSTSSGKSLIYQLPALTAFEKDPESTVMFIFPTKALAQDQKRALSELLKYCPELDTIQIATFDGDTAFGDRQYIRNNANVIFTNPDMLHCTILPKEEEWRRFFKNLKFVVVDELHVYDGLFGCHVAYVMRRLRRMCAAVGNMDVKFISCSATINNPEKHMQTIFGVDDVHVVSEDGSPSGRKEHVIWNAPFIDADNPTQGRVHSITETSRVFRFLMERGIRAIVFCKIRKMCELVMKQVRQDLADEGRSDMVHRVMSYRSGYNADDRRVIERKMFNGELLGIVATTALELGIDIGSLDAVITVGFPYTLSGLRQQSGRAGRRNKDSLSMLICDPWPLDQHYARCPDDLYSKPPSGVSLDLNNEIVLDGHLSCAAEELPIHPEEDSRWFGPDLQEMSDERLLKDEEGFYHCHPRYQPNPSRHVSLRATEDEHYSVVDITDGRYVIMEETEWSRAVFSVFEGAVFLHQGKTYIVQTVDHSSKIAKIVENNVDWSTRQRDYTDVDAAEAFRIRQIRDSDCTASYGRVKVTSKVFGYFKVDRKNNILDTVEIDQPPFVRDTHGMWLDVPKRAMDILALKNIHVAGSIHAAEHALLSLTPMFAMSVAGDVRTECKAPEKELASTATRRVRPARLTLYDASGKSGGICVKAFDRVTELVNQALEVILECPCEDGCPSCISSTVCSEGNIVLAKLGAMIVLACLSGRDIDVDAIPDQEPLHAEGAKNAETIRLADPVKASETTVRLAADGSTINRLADEALRGAHQGSSGPESR